MRQEGELAGTHEGEPGLPRGRSGLPAGEVREAQRERLLRAVIAAVDTAGFRNVTVADIVRGARVSRAAFYAHFADKEDCFLSATRQGGLLMAERVVSATRKMPDDTSAEDLLRASISAFTEFLAEEPAFARAFYVDMHMAGPRAVRQIENAQHTFARLNRSWHEHARRDHPSWPAVPYQAYYALACATTEIARTEVRRGGFDPGEVTDILLALHLAVLAARPWTAAEAGRDRHRAIAPGG
jgi:AcrR family transcriptional regulator